MNRNDPSAFEPSPTSAIPPQPAVANSAAVDNGSSTYTVTVDGIQYSVQIEEGSGSVAERLQISQSAQPQSGEWMNAGLAGTVHQVLVKVGDVVAAGEKILVLEAMKMETDVSAAVSGKVAAINISAGDQVSVGQALVLINSK
jgi:oxaloacetate decarboxylase alpha subunit